MILYLGHDIPAALAEGVEIETSGPQPVCKIVLGLGFGVQNSSHTSTWGFHFFFFGLLGFRKDHSILEFISGYLYIAVFI